MIDLIITLAADATQAEPWYKQVTGIVGIPATVVALVTSTQVIRKTNVEIRKAEAEREKTELETRKLRGELELVDASAAGTHVDAIVSSAVSSVGLEDRQLILRGQSYLTRFITLYIVLALLSTAGFISAAYLDFVRFLIIFGFGLPLLLAISRDVGLWPSKSRTRTRRRLIGKVR